MRMKRFPRSTIGLALLALAAAAQAQTTTSEIGTITVTGEGDRLGTGLMIDEDTPKAKSTVTKAEIDKLRSSSNPFQALAMLPGVNANSIDATGLFGGNLRVRGFNSDQMGFTINGAPVNDSGNFAVYPQEYSDAENLCEIFITQGATDTEAPHVGASGGNVGLSTCSPEDKRRVRVAFSGGDLSYARSFMRVDSGKIGDFKGFISFSKSEVDKWKGPGHADRNHVDAAVDYKLGITDLSASLLYNRAVNHNYRALSLSELATYGYEADYSATVPQHQTPVAGSAQTDAGTSSASPAYAGYSLNPFRNWLLTSKISTQFSPALRTDIEPYYWYGYGTGGQEQTVLGESNGGNVVHGGIADINGDGDTLDKVMIYRGSVTETHRPGVTAKLSYALENQQILAGVWFERARHRQTAPGTRVDNSGHIGDLWLANDAQLLHYADGTLYQNRNALTVSTGQSVFAQDTVDLLDSRLQVTPGISYREIKRDFNNYASSGSGAGADYALNKNYGAWLPSLGASYRLTPQWQGFASVTKNFKAPGNFEYFGLAQGVTYANGVGTAASLAPVTVQAETSTNVDLGLRFKGQDLKGSVTAYYVDFKNRIASSYDPNTGTSHDWNVGPAKIAGLEVELGTAPVHGFSAYASASYTRATITDDMQASATTTYATAGKIFPDTPKGMAALALQYTQGPAMINLSGKYTSGRYLTLVNDQRIPGYTTIDLNAALQLPGNDWVKNPIVRLNISNLTDHRYLLANLGSGSNIQITGTGNPTVYAAPPTFVSVSLQADF
jgi:iron complex outermembrane recepter protein